MNRHPDDESSKRLTLILAADLYMAKTHRVAYCENESGISNKDSGAFAQRLDIEMLNAFRHCQISNYKYKSNNAVWSWYILQ